jgi:Flp pilus assembly protein TadD
MISMHRAIALFSIIAGLTGTIDTAQALTLRVVSAQSSTVQLLETGKAKAKQGNHQGAIADFDKVLKANPKFTERLV